MTKANRRVIVEYGPEQLTAVVADLMQTIICDTISHYGVCRIALSGGTTPRPLYQLLAQSAVRGQVPWQSVQFFFGDERDVPHDNVESNYRMAQRLLLDHLPVDVENVFPMPADRGDLEQGAAEYERTIRRIVPAGPDGIPTFDLILLGVGSEGHVASLFPDSEAVEEKSKLVVAPFVPVLGRRRMTFTLPLINAARYVLCMVTGDDKAKVMADILTCDLAGQGEQDKKRRRPPAARVDPAGTLIFALDSAAAKYTEFAMK